MGATPGFLAAPPMSKILCTPTPSFSKASTASTNPQSIPSIMARAMFSRFELAKFIPLNTPFALGRLGVRSPSK